MSSGRGQQGRERGTSVLADLLSLAPILLDCCRLLGGLLLALLFRDGLLKDKVKRVLCPRLLDLCLGQEVVVDPVVLLRLLAGHVHDERLDVCVFVERRLL